MIEKKIIDVSIVIPCYQEENHILESVKEIYKTMNETNYTFEVIFVDDASSDKTKEKIEQLEKIFPNTRSIFHQVNSGKGRSIADGAKIASGRFIGHIDIDLEVSARYIPALIEELEKENDIALVKRKIRLSSSSKYILRDIGGKIHRWLVHKFLVIPHTDIQSGCKFFKSAVLLSLLDLTKSEGWFFDVELIAHAYYNNYCIQQVPGYYIRNKKKKSTVKLFGDGMEQIKNLIKFRRQLKKEKKK